MGFNKPYKQLLLLWFQRWAHFSNREHAIRSGAEDNARPSATATASPPYVSLARGFPVGGPARHRAAGSFAAQRCLTSDVAPQCEMPTCVASTVPQCQRPLHVKPRVLVLPGAFFVHQNL